MQDDVRTRRPGYAIRPMLRFGPGWRGARLAAVSDDMLSMVERDGTAVSLRFVPEPGDPGRASVVYVRGADESVLMSGDVGPVWAGFDTAASRFRGKAFPDSVRRWSAAALALAGVLLGMIGAVLLMQASGAGAHPARETVGAVERRWDL